MFLASCSEDSQLPFDSAIKFDIYSKLRTNHRYARYLNATASFLNLRVIPPRVAFGKHRVPPGNVGRLRQGASEQKGSRRIGRGEVERVTERFTSRFVG